MERGAAGYWEISGLEQMSDWAEELKSIPGTTISNHRRVLVDCDARVARILGSIPASEVTTGAVRKSIRIRPKAPAEPTEASGSIKTSLKAGDIFLNAVKVCLFH